MTNFFIKHNRGDKENTTINYTISGNSTVSIGNMNTIQTITQENYSDDEERFPSDLTIDHHSGRGGDYYLENDEEYEEDGDEENDEEIDHNDWKIRDLDISNKCFLLKKNTIQLEKNPGSLSDITLL